MDIRTKLVFALVSVALGSMLVFGALMYTRVGDQLRESRLNQLDGVAESKKEALQGIIRGWHEQVRLVASRTQLRASLREYRRSRSPGISERITEILADARRGSETVVSFSVHDAEGQVVGAVGEAGAATRATGLSALARSVSSVTYLGVDVPVAGNPEVRFLAPLEVEGEDLGFLHVVLRADELLGLALNYRGLGQTGETMIVVAASEGGVKVLHPVRHTEVARASVSIQDPTSAAVRAVGGEEEVFWEGVTDYAGHDVWAATRFVPETEWGVVVKVDAAEQEEPIGAFRAELVDLALILAAFASVLGVILGLRFAQPIHDLAGVANRVREGEMGARANVTREDEVGLLGRTFNQMAGELEEKMMLLHEYQRFFDVAVEMMCVAGTDGYFKRTNPAFESTLGWTGEELRSRQFYDFVHPDDVKMTEQEVAKLAQGIPTISFENRYRCADGLYKRLRWSSYPDPETGLLYAIAHVVGEWKAE